MEVVKSRSFNEEKLLDFVKNWSENTQLDFKQEYYQLGIESQLFKFIKHIIAFSNIARRTRKFCWIVFGIADGSREIFDVRNKYPGKTQPGGLKNPNNPKLDFREMMTNDYEEAFRKYMETWITPDIPEFTFEYGFILDPKNNEKKFVSYIKIHPSYTSVPFALKKPYKDYPAGTSFIRKNSSSVVVPQVEKKFLLSAHEAAYINEDEWKNYLAHYQNGDFRKMHDDIEPWIMPIIEDYDGENSFNYIYTCIGKHKKIAIIGNRGEGKSVILHRLTYVITTRHNLHQPSNQREYGENHNPKLREEDTTIDSVKDEIEVNLKYPIPIFLYLRTSFSLSSDIDKTISQNIEEKLGKEYDGKRSPSSYWNIPGTKWILFLDGLDELRNKDAGSILQMWINCLPSNVTVVITSRPYAFQISKIHEEIYFVISLKNLRQKIVREYIQRRIFLNSDLLEQSFEESTEDILLKVFNWMDKNPEIYSLLNNFRALDGFFEASFPSLVKSKLTIDEKKEYATIPRNIEVVRGETVDPSQLSISEDLTFYGSEGWISERKKIDEQNPFLLHETAVIIQEIIDYIETEEIKRNLNFGTDSKPLAKRARNSLGKIAWNLDWNNDKFNYDNCIQQTWIKEEQIDWNNEIGFIQPYHNYIHYSFFNHLLKKFFSAEFAYNQEFECSEIKRTYSRQSDSKTANHVIALLRELLIANGRKPIDYKEGEIICQ